LIGQGLFPGWNSNPQAFSGIAFQGDTVYNAVKENVKRGVEQLKSPAPILSGNSIPANSKSSEAITIWILGKLSFWIKKRKAGGGSTPPAGWNAETSEGFALI
jgi:hypothetical protein